MKDEIEINRKVANKDGLLAYLRNLTTEKLTYITMTYFYMRDKHNFYARIEEIREKVDGPADIFLTAKTNFTEENSVNKRTEARIEIGQQKSNKEQCMSFLTSVGLEKKDTKNKVRHEFTIDSMVITVDEWDNAELGCRLEVEGDHENKLRSFVQRVEDFLVK